MIPRFQAMMLALAMLVSGPLLAQTATQGPCTAVSQAVLTLNPPADFRGPWSSPVRTLNTASGGLVTIDTEGWRADSRQAGLDKLREIRASQPLREAIATLTSDSWLFSLHRFGRSSLSVAEVVQGTAYCQYFVFLDTSLTGGSDMIGEPPSARSTNGPAFCWRSSAYAGEVAGLPAFIAQNDREDTVTLTITPWRDGQWQQACQVTIRFEPVFEVTNRFCQGVDCAVVANQALAAVKQVDQGGAPSDYGTETFKAMKKLAEDDPPNNELPTFGGTYADAYRQFAPDSSMVPIVVGGKTFLGRVGHAAFAWRISPDYLVALYERMGTRLEPVAGLYISKTRGKPLSATVE